MSFSDSLTRLRRFLRDPDGTIWTDADIMTYYNDSQVEIAQKTGLLLKVETLNYPPEYDYSYLHDWEYEFISGSLYQALFVNQLVDDEVISHVWEAYYEGDGLTYPDDTDRLVHPWEAEYCDFDAIIPIPLNSRFDKMRILAYDQEIMAPITEREVTERDRYWETTTGLAQWYYIPDEWQNQIVLYPRPSSVQWVTIGTDIDTDGVVLLVYDAVPDDMTTTASVSDFPAWLVKYAEHGTLERCFGADTDGFIPSLLSLIHI